MEEKAMVLPVANGTGGNCSRSSISPIHMHRRLMALGKGTKTSSYMFVAVEPPLPLRTCSMAVRMADMLVLSGYMRFFALLN